MPPAFLLRPAGEQNRGRDRARQHMIGAVHGQYSVVQDRAGQDKAASKGHPDSARAHTCRESCKSNRPHTTEQACQSLSMSRHQPLQPPFQPPPCLPLGSAAGAAAASSSSSSGGGGPSYCRGQNRTQDGIRRHKTKHTHTRQDGRGRKTADRTAEEGRQPRLSTVHRPQPRC